MELTVANFFNKVSKITYEYERKNNFNIVFCPSFDFTTGLYTVEIKKAITHYDYQTIKVISSSNQVDILELVKKEVEGK